MNYLARLHALKAEKCPTVKLTKPTKPHPTDAKAGFVSFVSYSNRLFSGNTIASADPAAWVSALASLDASRAPNGIAPDWWRTVLADAVWIARNHADTAAAFGWTASDLFGIRPHLGPGNGGLADRLDGTRRLVFTVRVAHWRGDEWEGWLWRRTLDPKPLLWEVGAQGDGVTYHGRESK